MPDVYADCFALIPVPPEMVAIYERKLTYAIEAKGADLTEIVWEEVTLSEFTVDGEFFPEQTVLKGTAFGSYDSSSC